MAEPVAIVQDQVDLHPLGYFTIDDAQEVKDSLRRCREKHGPTIWPVALSRRRTGGRRWRCAGSRTPSFGPPRRYRQVRLGAVQRLDLELPVERQHDCVPGGLRQSPPMRHPSSVKVVMQLVRSTRKSGVGGNAANNIGHGLRKSGLATTMEQVPAPPGCPWL